MTFYIVPNDCLSLFGLKQMGQFGMKIDTASRKIFSAAQTESPIPQSDSLPNTGIRNPLLLTEGVEELMSHKDTPNFEGRAEIVRKKAELRKHGKRNAEKKVQHKLLKSDFRKGQSPKSKPVRIVSQIGRWNFQLSDGQIWNARALSKYRPARHKNRRRQIIKDEFYDDFPEIIEIPQEIDLRKSKRIIFAKSPIRFSPGRQIEETELWLELMIRA